MNKIFGLGLSKTGTGSLTEALHVLGFNVVHNPWRTPLLTQFEDGDFTLPFEFDAITENVVPYFRVFDREYPGSKFILTHRDYASWARSIEHWYAHQERYNRKFRVLVFGCHRYNRAHFRDKYRDYQMIIRNHFRHRQRDLLRIDICGGEGWRRLCPFVGRKVPDVEFPWANKQEYE